MGRVTYRDAGKGKDSWVYRDDAPGGGWIGDVLGYSFVAKLRGAYVYPVLCLKLTWHVDNSDYVDPVMDELERALERFGLERTDAWNDGTFRSEVWYDPHNYAAHDMVRTFKSVMRLLKWSEYAEIGYWPESVIDSTGTCI